MKITGKSVSNWDSDTLWMKEKYLKIQFLNSESKCWLDVWGKGAIYLGGKMDEDTILHSVIADHIHSWPKFPVMSSF